MLATKMIKDSGNRSEFNSGAVRDIQAGKGRCDLLPLVEVGLVAIDEILGYIGEFVECGDEEWIKRAIKEFVDKAFGDLPTALIEVSIHYEEGAQKYSDRNWEKGIPLHCFVNSGVRHYLKYMRGDEDERHDRAFLWNMFGLLWTLRNFPELNDLPCASEIKLDE